MKIKTWKTIEMSHGSKSKEHNRTLKWWGTGMVEWSIECSQNSWRDYEGNELVKALRIAKCGKST
jgi:hypothetical protein